MNSWSLCSLPFQPLAHLHLPPAQQAVAGVSLLQTPSACVWPDALTRKLEFTTCLPAPSCFSQLPGEFYSPQMSPPSLSECIAVIRTGREGCANGARVTGISRGRRGLNSLSISLDRSSHLPWHHQKEHLEKTR